MTPPQTPQTWTAAEMELEAYNCFESCGCDPSPEFGCSHSRRASMLRYAAALRAENERLTACKAEAIKLADFLDRGVPVYGHDFQGQCYEAALAIEMTRNRAESAESALAAKDAEIARLTTRCEQLTAGYKAILSGERGRLTAERQKVEKLREVLSNLRIDANRLCDRNLGGTYEDDCRRSLKKAEQALAGLAPAPTTGGQS